jgi:glutaminyl-tRNA synthetase
VRRRPEKALADRINPNSLKIAHAYVESSLGGAKPEERFQFVRNGFFCADMMDCEKGRLVFNKTVGLKSGWTPPPAE